MKKQTPVDNILSEVGALIKWFEDYEEWYENPGDNPPPPPPQNPPGGDTPPPPTKP